MLELANEDIYEENVEILIGIFEKNGYFLETGRQDTIIEISSTFYKQRNDLKFFDVVAPYVEKGTAIRLCDENGLPMRLTFDGQGCHCSAIKRNLDEKISRAEKTAHKINKEQGAIDRLPREEIK